MTRDEKITAACMTRGANEAARYLRGIGIDTSESRCAVRISQLIASGRRAEPTVPKLHSPDSFTVSEHAARQGSDALRDATLALYQRKADREGCSVEQAMMRSQFGRALADKWERRERARKAAAA